MRHEHVLERAEAHSSGESLGFVVPHHREVTFIDVFSGEAHRVLHLLALLQGNLHRLSAHAKHDKRQFILHLHTAGKAQRQVERPVGVALVGDLMARDKAVAGFLATFDKRLRGAAIRHLERVHRSAGNEPYRSGVAGIVRKGGARCVRRIAQRRRELHALVHDHAGGEVVLEGRIAQSIHLLRLEGGPVTDLERCPRSRLRVHLRLVPGKRGFIGIERDEPVHHGERDRPQRHRPAVAERKRRAHAVRPLEQRHKADVGHARCVRLVARKVERQRAAIEGPFDPADHAVRFARNRKGGTRASHLVVRQREHELLSLGPVGERIARAQGDLTAHDRRVPQRREAARLHADLLTPRGDVERGRLQDD